MIAGWVLLGLALLTLLTFVPSPLSGTLFPLRLLFIGLVAAAIVATLVLDQQTTLRDGILIAGGAVLLIAIAAQFIMMQQQRRPGLSDYERASRATTRLGNMEDLTFSRGKGETGFGTKEDGAPKNLADLILERAKDGAVNFERLGLVLEREIDRFEERIRGGERGIDVDLNDLGDMLESEGAIS